MFPEPLLRLVQLLARLPGVGEKTAHRYALFLLTADPAIAKELGAALVGLHERIGPCPVCGHIAEHREGERRCSICLDERRDDALLCVVHRVQDLLAIERSGMLRGRYHVLGKLLSPLDGVGAADLGLGRLVARIQGSAGAIREVLIATPPSVDGEATALLLSRELPPLGVVVTRIASGVPHGGDLEFADPITLGRAIEHRRNVG